VSGALLDTSILIGSPDTVDELPVNGAISVVTLGELHAGVHLARTDEIRRLRQRRLDAIRTAFVPIPVDEPVAESYGEVLALARHQRVAARATDVLIIATAAATTRMLYTLDAAQARRARAADVLVA
jgi:predicted nucleic acid-binding protein